MVCDLSELSPYNLAISSLTWFVVVAWSEFINVVIHGIAKALKAQDGVKEMVMRFISASIITMGAYAFYKYHYDPSQDVKK